MKTNTAILIAALFSLTACNKNPAPASGPTPGSQRSADAVQQKLQDYAGASATDCGRLEVHAPDAQAKAASDCALQASQNKHPFYVAYDMPGMAVGVAGNPEGKLFSVQSQGEGSTATLTTGACPSELRVAASGRVTCFAPGDMGSMSGHAAIPPGTTNPHAATPGAADKKP